jgi:hypothetical protein
VIFLPRAVRVYFATAPMNLRKSFDGLSNEVRAVLVRDPPSGDNVQLRAENLKLRTEVAELRTRLDLRASRPEREPRLRRRR